MAERHLALLGLAQKAGKIAAGDMAVQEALARKRAKLLIVAADASDGTKENFRCLARRYQIEYRECANKLILGASIGKGPRAVIAVLDQGFAASISRALQQ